MEKLEKAVQGRYVGDASMDYGGASERVRPLFLSHVV